jgi:hypothetical protein
MLTHSTIVSHRKAIGSIVGTAFFVLILLSGYYFYTLMNQGEAQQARVLSDMRTFDIERAQEALAVIDSNNPVQANGNDLLVSLKNTGSRPLNITRVGFWDGVHSTWNYTPTVTISPDSIRLITGPEQGIGEYGLRVEAGASCSLQVNTSGIEPNQPEGTYKVQFLTENGLLFTVSYP